MLQRSLPHYLSSRLDTQRNIPSDHTSGDNFEVSNGFIAPNTQKAQASASMEGPGELRLQDMLMLVNELLAT